jgi:cell division protein FtsQ
VLLVATVLSAAVLFVIVLTSAIKKQNQLVCRNIQVKIDYDSGLAFLTEAEIKDKIDYLCGGSITGKPLAGIDFRTLEKTVRKNPFVGDAEIFVNQQQGVVVDIVQKRPILRVINNDGVSYYISEKNERIPVSDNFTSHVAIALGNVAMHKDTKRDSAVQAALYKLILFVRKDDFLNALVDQVYVREDGEMEVIPKVGGQTIRFGEVDENMAEKFDRLKIFYNEGLRKVGWDKYRTIDLRYKDQVVCEKKDTTNKL